MTTLAEYKNCSTADLRELDLQLISQINEMAPGALVDFSHLDVKIMSACHPYVQAPGIPALEKAIKSRGETLIVNSAYRTIAQQFVLWNHCMNSRCNISAAAIPGKSNHNTALSIDVDDYDSWKPYLEKNNWMWLGAFDPMHFDFKGTSTRDIRSLSIKAFQILWNLNNPTRSIKDDGIWGNQTKNALLQTPVNGF